MRVRARISALSVGFFAVRNVFINNAERTVTLADSISIFVRDECRSTGAMSQQGFTINRRFTQTQRIPF